MHAPLILSHETALLYHRAARLAQARGRELRLGDTHASAPAHARTIARQLGLITPLDVIGTSSRSKSLSVHAARGGIPSSQLAPIAADVLACSPQLALCQIAGSCGSTTLGLYAFEATGTFAIDKSAQAGFENDLAPLTSTSEILECLGQLEHGTDSRWVRELRRLLGYLSDGAASPAEAKLALAIGSPRSMGGQGLPRPELNIDIPLGHKLAMLTDKQSVRPDLLWHEWGLALDYLGQIHADPRRMEQDVGRDNAISALGLHHIRVTKLQLQRPDLYRGLMDELRMRLGARQHMPTPKVVAKQESLRHLLFGTARDDGFGPIIF